MSFPWVDAFHRVTDRLRTAALALGVLAGSLTVASCGTSGDETAPSSRLPTSRAAAQGNEITLTGYVTRTFGARVLELGAARGEPLIVVLRRPQTVLVGQRVEAGGEVRKFRRAELESELGVDLGPEVMALEGQRCLLVRSLRLVSQETAGAPVTPGAALDGAKGASDRDG